MLIAEWNRQKKEKIKIQSTLEVKFWGAVSYGESSDMWQTRYF